MRINQNVMAFNAYRSLSNTNLEMGKSLEKLSSGFRINKAADDAAGLVISENLRSQVSGMRVASRNAQDGISVVQTAEGSLQEVHAILQRIRDLAAQSANTGANDVTARNAAQSEISQLSLEIDRIGVSTRFGTLGLFTTATLTFQIGPNAGDTINVTLGAMSTATLTVSAVNVSTGAGAATALASLDVAITSVSTMRANLGAIQNRFETTIRNLTVAIENASSAESRIRDTDMALEMVEFTKTQILARAGTAMLGQANQVPQQVLSLLEN
jgi:flagellin